MKPLSERDENALLATSLTFLLTSVGMKPLSERDENPQNFKINDNFSSSVGMKPLSERDENMEGTIKMCSYFSKGRNEATL